MNAEKTKVVNTLNGEAFGFLGFELRREPKREKEGRFLQLTPRKKARLAIKAKIRDLIRHGGATPMKELVSRNWLAGSTTSGSATPVAPSVKYATMSR